ncbi:hypothetical protein EYZ11_003273 [Aspergillus tanneri]|uniref:Uncharacterized protein n=1 Tax=Aspergillus tanneri TaxID=1220188 RepID=A0A4S3JTP6_9EURO|nr:hypothetical protein EYZ11_003273 [Aspergillus tanneri]
MQAELFGWRTVTIASHAPNADALDGACEVEIFPKTPVELFVGKRPEVFVVGRKSPPPNKVLEFAEAIE